MLNFYPTGAYENLFFPTKSSFCFPVHCIKKLFTPIIKVYSVTLTCQKMVWTLILKGIYVKYCNYFLFVYFTYKYKSTHTYQYCYFLLRLEISVYNHTHSWACNIYVTKLIFLLCLVSGLDFSVYYAKKPAFISEVVVFLKIAICMVMPSMIWRHAYS